MRKLRRNAVTRSIIALLAAAAALYLLLVSSGWQSLPFAGACVAAFVTVYWAQLAFASLVQAVRAGAFESWDDDAEDYPESDGSELPIDVEHRQ